MSFSKVFLNEKGPSRPARTCNLFRQSDLDLSASSVDCGIGLTTRSKQRLLARSLVETGPYTEKSKGGRRNTDWGLRFSGDGGKPVEAREGMDRIEKSDLAMELKTCSVSRHGERFHERFVHQRSRSTSRSPWHSTAGEKQGSDDSLHTHTHTPHTHKRTHADSCWHQSKRAFSLATRRRPYGKMYNCV